MFSALLLILKWPAGVWCEAGFVLSLVLCYRAVLVLLVCKYFIGEFVLGVYFFLLCGLASAHIHFS